MPTYEYKREDGTTFEIMQRITDDALELCPTTGQKVKRLIGGGAGLIFKGKGFYVTDYARKKPPADEGASGDKSESASGEKSVANDSGSKKTDASSTSNARKSESKSTSSSSSTSSKGSA